MGTDEMGGRDNIHRNVAISEVDRWDIPLPYLFAGVAENGHLHRATLMSRLPPLLRFYDRVPVPAGSVLLV